MSQEEPPPFTKPMAGALSCVAESELWPPGARPESRGQARAVCFATALVQGHYDATGTNQLLAPTLIQRTHDDFTLLG